MVNNFLIVTNDENGNALVLTSTLKELCARYGMRELENDYPPYSAIVNWLNAFAKDFGGIGPITIFSENNIAKLKNTLEVFNGSLLNVPAQYEHSVTLM